MRHAGIRPFSSPAPHDTRPSRYTPRGTSTRNHLRGWPRRPRCTCLMVAPIRKKARHSGARKHRLDRSGDREHHEGIAQAQAERQHPVPALPAGRTPWPATGAERARALVTRLSRTGYGSSRPRIRERGSGTAQAAYQSQVSGCSMARLSLLASRPLMQRTSNQMIRARKIRKPIPIGDVMTPITANKSPIQNVRIW